MIYRVTIRNVSGKAKDVNAVSAQLIENPMSLAEYGRTTSDGTLWRYEKPVGHPCYPAHGIKRFGEFTYVYVETIHLRDAVEQATQIYFATTPF